MQNTPNNSEYVTLSEGETEIIRLELHQMCEQLEVLIRETRAEQRRFAKQLREIVNTRSDFGTVRRLVAPNRRRVLAARIMALQANAQEQRSAVQEYLDELRRTRRLIVAQLKSLERNGMLRKFA